jgi:formylglycine-generating enzyme required for sulfatase activity
VTGVFAARCAAPLTATQERGLKPKDAFRECADCPEMVVVPAGSFTMGSPKDEGGRNDNEGPQHVVTIARPFAVGKLHVTVDQFAAFARDSLHEAKVAGCVTYAEGGKEEERSDRSWGNTGFPQESGHPVVCLDWEDAKAYVGWLVKKTGKPYRLLTEAEWEYAARGRTAPGAHPRFWFGNDVKDLCRHGNGLDKTAGYTIPGAKDLSQLAPCDDGYAYTAPAGHYAPNAFGLYDMAGNALQWTEDCLSDDYKGAPTNGSAFQTGFCGFGHVIRGGSWNDNPRRLRAAQREWARGPIVTVGFRVARAIEAAGSPSPQNVRPPDKKDAP